MHAAGSKDLLQFVTQCYITEKHFHPGAAIKEDSRDGEYNRTQRRNVMKTQMVMDTLLACIGCMVMVKIGMVLATYNGTVQLLGALPQEFLYITAVPLVF
jgi:hypothetical protein